MSDTQRTGSDRGILHHIEALVAEEHTLLGRGGLDDHERAQLDRVKVELDQCWDLLRQRRALREFGEDPAAANVRPVSVVEKYEG